MSSELRSKNHELGDIKPKIHTSLFLIHNLGGTSPPGRGPFEREDVVPLFLYHDN